ncbi:MAG: hypothetical protein ABI681_04595 [Gemmatimonadales bacterium]
MTQRTRSGYTLTIGGCLIAIAAIAVVSSGYTHAPLPSKSNVAAPDMNSGANGLKGSLEDDEKKTQPYFLTMSWGDDLPDSAVWEGKFGADSVRIRIVPATTSLGVDWANALSKDPAKYSGHLVAKIIVLEDRSVDELGLRGFDTGYLWVGQRGKNAADGLGAAIYTIKPNGTAHREAYMDITGKCAAVHRGPMAKVRLEPYCSGPVSFNARAGPPMLAAGQGLWVTCTGGCCEVKPR